MTGGTDGTFGLSGERDILNLPCVPADTHRGMPAVLRVKVAGIVGRVRVKEYADRNWAIRLRALILR